MHSRKNLNIAVLNDALQNAISRELGISRVTAQLLINRGVRSVGEAEKFLNVKIEYLADPFLFSDMHAAVNLVKKAARHKEKVMVVGDYDVDGVTSVALLKSTLAGLGIPVTHYLPHRLKEGYGLNKNVVRQAKAEGIQLLITADCGTNNLATIKDMRECGIEVVITDHHEQSTHQAADASAIINPKMRGSQYPYRDLAGVGVAFKFCQAITARTLENDLDIVALGTVADVVPLTGENRIIVKEGLLRLSNTPKAGLKALMAISSLRGKKMNSGYVSYILGPRINASGRIDTAEVALNLLMSQEDVEAGQIAKLIDSYNRQRQKIEGKILEEAKALIDKEVNFKDDKVIVIAKEDWHQGVLGIVASKLADRFYRPTILISMTDDLCKGSGRSIEKFHLFEALVECRDLLTDFGGHSHAAGFVINRESIRHFKDKINLVAQDKLLVEDLVPSIPVDMELRLEDIDEKFLSELEVLEPYGCGNPQPLFCTRGLHLKGEPQTFSKETLKFWVTDTTATYPAIGFGMSGLKEDLTQADSFDLVYRLKLDDWQGQNTILLEIEEIFFT